MSKISPEFSRFINSIIHDLEPTTPEEEALKRYIKVVLSMAKKYQRYGVEYEDIVMAGITGILEAVKDRRPKGGNFTAYVIMRITSRMYELALSNTSLMSVPSYIAKVKIYLYKMYRILDQEPILFEASIPKQEIVAVFEHPAEELLPLFQQNKLRSLKNKVVTIASSAGTSYEEIIKRAIFHRRRDLNTTEDTYQIAGHIDIERTTAANEAMEKVTKGLDIKKTMALKLHYHGFNNEDIANILFEAGLTRHRVTRQAVKLMLDVANRRVRRAGNIWGSR